MTDFSSEKNNTLSSAKSHAAPAQILRASFTCPVCNQNVVQIEGNAITFLHSHIRHDPNDPNSTIFFHPPTIGTDFVPARVAEMPFLVMGACTIVAPTPAHLDNK